MEEVIQRGNAKAALKRVKQNKGSPGVDGMIVDELPKYPGGPLDGDPRAVAGGDLPAEAGETRPVGPILRADGVFGKDNDPEDTIGGPDAGPVPLDHRGELLPKGEVLQQELPPRTPD